MRKNINRLVAFAIGISVMSGAAIPVFAADSTTTTSNSTTATSAQSTTTAVSGQTQTNNIVTGTQVKVKPILTLEAAISAGISNSGKLGLQKKKINLQEDKLDIQEDLGNDDGYAHDSQDLAIKQAKQDKEILEDQITQDVTDAYYEIVAGDKKLENMKKDLEIKTKEFKDSELKQKLGLLTSTDLKTLEINLQTAKNSLQDKENTLKNSKDFFKVLTDKNLNDYILEQDPKFEVFKIEGSVDEYLDNIVEKYYKYEKRSAELLKDYVKDIKVSRPSEAPSSSDYSDDVDATTGLVTKSARAKYNDAMDKYKADMASYQNYLETRYNSSVKSVTLDDNKKNTKQTLKTNYAKLLNLENTINTDRANLEVNNKQLSTLKLKYDMGLVTKTEYNKQVLQSEDLDTKLRADIDEYNKLKNKIRKPWLAGSMGMY